MQFGRAQGSFQTLSIVLVAESRRGRLGFCGVAHADATLHSDALRRLPLPAVEEVEQLVFHPRPKTVVKQYTCKVIAIPEAGHEEASGEVFSPLPDSTVAAALASSEP